MLQYIRTKGEAMRIAVCQLDIKYEDKEYNLARAKEFISDAASEGADIIFFPEMSFTGFSMNTELTGEEDSYTPSLMEEYAEEFNIAIGFGWVENKTESENHYTVVDSTGEMIADYRKIHLFEDAEEDQHFIAGDEIVVFSCDEIDFGISICYDLRFDDVYEDLEPITDAVIVAANWPASRIEDWRQLLNDRAYELNSYMIGINCYGEQDGEHYSGNSSVIGPDREVLLEIEDMEDMVIVDIDKVE